MSGCSFQGCQVQITIIMPSASAETRSNALCEDVDLSNIELMNCLNSTSNGQLMSHNV